MKVSGTVYVHIQLTDFEVFEEDYDKIRSDLGVVSPARMLSEYLYLRLKKDGWLVTQVSAVPERWEE